MESILILILISVTFSGGGFWINPMTKSGFELEPGGWKLKRCWLLSINGGGVVGEDEEEREKGRKGRK